RATQCVPDDDQSGGFVIAVVVDSPGGGTGNEKVTSPPTDTVDGARDRPVDMRPALTFLVLVAGGVMLGVRYRRSH
ncbi:MAG: hypothetical protein ACJ78L_05810, partial [Chloroflexota bacterium]